MGIFNALFLAIFVVVSLTIGMIPVLTLFSTIFIAFFCAMAYVLLTLRVAAQGVFFISAIVQNILFLLLFGLNPFMLVFVVFALVGAIIAEWVARIRRFHSVFALGVGYVIYLSCLTIGFFSPVYFWMDKFRELYGDSALLEQISVTFLVLITVLTAIAAASGYWVCYRLLNKKFAGTDLLTNK
jgi:hypothetical protein